jgi:hypothetical protein
MFRYDFSDYKRKYGGSIKEQKRKEKDDGGERGRLNI